MKKVYIGLSVVLCGLFTSCNDDFENDIKDIPVQAGEADFSKYIALGNSLTAGYADGALYKSGQENSYPVMMAQQMAKAGGGTFTVPYMLDDIGGFSDLYAATEGANFYGKLTLQMNEGNLVPVPTAPKFSFQETVKSGAYGNMGVPGAKSYHLLADNYGNPAYIATGLANPYFARFTSDPSASVIAEAVKQNPTFFTLWIGSNDILGYASQGASGTNQAGNFDPSTYAGGDLSDPVVVENAIKTILEVMVKQVKAKGAIANLPEITGIPFFTTIPAKPLSPLNKDFAAQIDKLNQFYAPLNQVFEALGKPERKIVFSKTEANGVVLVDETLQSLTPQIQAALIGAGLPANQAGLLAQIYGQTRQSAEGDLIPLPVRSKLAKVDMERVQALMGMGVSQEQAGLLSVYGLTYPIIDKDILTTEEVQTIADATAKVNNSIAKLATTYDIALVDMNSKMKSLKGGFLYQGVTYTTAYVSGGAFSLDGVHLNARGYAVVANTFMEAINKKYKATLPAVNPNNYPGVQIP